MKSKIINFSILHPYKMITIIIFLTGLITFGSKWIIVDDDFMKIIPNDVQSKIEWDKITNEFGNVDLMFIAFGRKGFSIFNEKLFPIFGT